MIPADLGRILKGAALGALMTGCVGPPGESIPSAPPVDGRYYVACEAARPEVCPRHMDPVCGYSQGGRRNYPNPCLACADSRMNGYRRGECPRADPVPDLDADPGLRRLR